jgi:hypothetical protein
MIVSGVVGPTDSSDTFAAPRRVKGRVAAVVPAAMDGRPAALDVRRMPVRRLPLRRKLSKVGLGRLANLECDTDCHAAWLGYNSGLRLAR